MSDLLESLREHQRVIAALEPRLPEIERAARRMIDALSAGGKIVWMGNGGSAADAQHLAAELMGRFERDRPALASLAVTTDTSILTAVGNDMGFDDIFARQVRGLCVTRDFVVGLSTSGNSPNVLRAIEAAKAIGAATLALSGRDGGKLAQLADQSLIVPASNTARIQEAHIMIGHMICGLIETHFATAGARRD